VVGRIKHLENDESRSAQQEGTPPPYDFSRMSLELGILEEQLNCSQIQMFFVGLYIKRDLHIRLQELAIEHGVKLKLL
jgi:hypothetical protein